MNHELQEFYLKLEEPQRSCMEALRIIILKYSDDFSEEWKYKLPFFYHKKKMFCYMWIDKKTKFPYICFSDGYLMDHPMLEKGDRKRMKAILIDPEEDIPIEVLDEIFRMALDLRK